jgi:hypothetical protein
LAFYAYNSEPEKEKDVTSSFVISEIKKIIFLEFEAVSDADICKSKYCSSVAGPRIKQ